MNEPSAEKNWPTQIKAEHGEKTVCCGLPAVDSLLSIPESLRHTSLGKVCLKPPDFKQTLYKVARSAVYLYCSTLFGVDTEGVENIPKDGGCLIASNHVSLFDPPLVSIAIKFRQVHFVAKKDLFMIPLLGPVLAGCGCVWVDRSSKDGSSVNQAVDLLKSGRLVGIFPEGTRSKDGKLQRGKLGVAVMALKSGAPIVPACVFNTYEVGQNHGIPCGRRLSIRFGSPIFVGLNEQPDPKAMKEVSNKVMTAIADLQYLGPVSPS
ncbi:MAG: lysophospholipid acyltransferase family protein [Candidatus Bruticola sp.]